uniref:Peptidase S1 domain-containing protein n=1 Tax=Romanomermis culicivorax TaxID=13658 RepID=A0A915JE94_ROMCU
MDTRFCNKSFPAFNGFLSNAAMICAGYRAGKYDACQGDSGGPLIMPMRDSNNLSKIYFVLVGAVSFGDGCAEPNRPGIYTRISTYLDWLNTKFPVLIERN